jgi:hypothetical protein
MQDQIVGTWTLDSFELEDAETRKRRPWGQDVHGLLIYAPTGHMSVSINKSVENDPEQSDCENRFDSVLFYSGTYQAKGKTITHQVTEASNPDRIGREMIRYAEWSNGLLELITPVESWGRAILRWKKAQ